MMPFSMLNHDSDRRIIQLVIKLKLPTISSIKNSMEINNTMNDFYYKRYQLASSFKHKYYWVILEIKGDIDY